MSDELQYLWRCLSGEFGWPIALVTWPTVLRLVFKPTSRFILAYVESRPATETQWAQRLLASSVWGLIAFLVDYLASLKLPVAPKGSH